MVINECIKVFEVFFFVVFWVQIGFLNKKPWFFDHHNSQNPRNFKWHVICFFFLEKNKAESSVLSTFKKI